jgi:hypothetical protein
MEKSLNWKVALMAGAAAGITLGGFTPAVTAAHSAPPVHVVPSVTAKGAPAKAQPAWHGGPHPAAASAIACQQDSSTSSNSSSFSLELFLPPCPPVWAQAPTPLPALEKRQR